MIKITDLEIIKALMNGNHLNDLELNRAKRLVYSLDMNLKTR